MRRGGERGPLKGLSFCQLLPGGAPRCCRGCSNPLRTSRHRGSLSLAIADEQMYKKNTRDEIHRNPRRSIAAIAHRGTREGVPDPRILVGACFARPPPAKKENARPRGSQCARYLTPHTTYTPPRDRAPPTPAPESNSLTVTAARWTLFNNTNGGRAMAPR